MSLPVCKKMLQISLTRHDSGASHLSLCIPTWIRDTYMYVRTSMLYGKATLDFKNSIIKVIKLIVRHCVFSLTNEWLSYTSVHSRTSGNHMYTCNDYTATECTQSWQRRHNKLNVLHIAVIHCIHCRHQWVGMIPTHWCLQCMTAEHSYGRTKKYTNKIMSIREYPDHPYL